MTWTAARYGYLLWMLAFSFHHVIAQNLNDSTASDSSNSGAVTAIAVIVSIFSLIAFIFIAYICIKYLRVEFGSRNSWPPPNPGYNNPPQPGYNSPPPPSYNFRHQTVPIPTQTVVLPERNSLVEGSQARAFSLDEVLRCTSNRQTIIGKGGFGNVYYGKLQNGAEVAVKINLVDSVQGTPEFVTEVSLLSRIHHRHLVSLMGYCTENRQQILIYEYMPEGTLQDHLYGKVDARKLTWKDRLQIALDSAKGLEYLHDGCKPSIIHRDIKSTNILLDAKLQAKVADFGISKVYPEDQTNSITTLIRGTFGYLDPEYFSSGHLTHKSDVYSFGVVLLELICGRRPYMADHEDPYQCSLVDWVRERFKEKDIESIVDPAIKSTYCELAMEKIATLAIECVQMMRVNRPEMHQVVRKLSKAVQLEEQELNETGKPLEVVVHSEECEITPWNLSGQDQEAFIGIPDRSVDLKPCSDEILTRLLSWSTFRKKKSLRIIGIFTDLGELPYESYGPKQLAGIFSELW